MWIEDEFYAFLRHLKVLKIRIDNDAFFNETKAFNGRRKNDS